MAVNSVYKDSLLEMEKEVSLNVEFFFDGWVKLLILGVFFSYLL